MSIMPTTVAYLRAIHELENKEYQKKITKVERFVLQSDVESLRVRLMPHNGLANRFEKKKWDEAAIAAAAAARLRGLAIIKMLGQAYEGHGQKDRLRDIIITHSCESKHPEILEEALAWPGENPGVIAKHLMDAATNHEKEISDLLRGSIKNPKDVIAAMAINPQMDREREYGSHIRARACFQQLLTGLPAEPLQELYEQQITLADGWGVSCIRKTWAAASALQMDKTTPGAGSRKHLARL